MKKKAPGQDGIPNEFYKMLTREGMEELLKMMNKIWKEAKIPESWKEALILPIHKSGEEKEAKNYRGIALLNSSYIIMTSINV